MNFLFFDFETDSKDPQTARVLEAACVITSPRGRVLHSGSLVIQQPEYNKEVEDIVNLRDWEVKQGLSELDLVAFLTSFFSSNVKYIVGHNILSYDCKILDRFGGYVADKVCIDTMIDLPFPERTTSKRLSHLCADHGIPTPNAHGALHDCLYTAELFFKYDWATVVERANTPFLYVQAAVNQDTKDKCKPFGFRWDPKQKIWWKQVRLYDREEFLTKINGAFEVHRLPEYFKPSEG